MNSRDIAWLNKVKTWFEAGLKILIIALEICAVILTAVVCNLCGLIFFEYGASAFFIATGFLSFILWKWDKKYLWARFSISLVVVLATFVGLIYFAPRLLIYETALEMFFYFVGFLLGIFMGFLSLPLKNK